MLKTYMWKSMQHYPMAYFKIWEDLKKTDWGWFLAKNAIKIQTRRVFLNVLHCIYSSSILAKQSVWQQTENSKYKCSRQSLFCKKLHLAVTKKWSQLQYKVGTIRQTLKYALTTLKRVPNTQNALHVLHDFPNVLIDVPSSILKYGNWCYKLEIKELDPHTVELTNSCI